MSETILSVPYEYNPYKIPPRRVVFTFHQRPEHAGSDHRFDTEVGKAMLEFEAAARQRNAIWDLRDMHPRDARGIAVNFGAAQGDFLASNGVLVEWKAWSFEDTLRWKLRCLWPRFKYNVRKWWKGLK